MIMKVGDLLNILGTADMDQEVNLEVGADGAIHEGLLATAQVPGDWRKPVVLTTEAGA